MSTMSTYLCSADLLLHVDVDNDGCGMSGCFTCGTLVDLDADATARIDLTVRATSVHHARFLADNILSRMGGEIADDITVRRLA